MTQLSKTEKKKKQPRQFGVTEYYKLINRETWSVAKTYFFQKGQRGMVKFWCGNSEHSGQGAHPCSADTAGGSCVSIVLEINRL